MFVIRETELYKEILSPQNIFSAIYSLDSYIFEKNLLSKKDLTYYYRLKDKYNQTLIQTTINECQKMLESILCSENLFEIQVYFKAKKLETDISEDQTESSDAQTIVKCRPMHTASLITQICIVCLLNVLVYKNDKKGIRQLSDLSQLIPSNFYGNIPCTSPERIFFDWKEKYKEYSEAVISSYDAAKKDNTYKYQVALDLKNFFPSIDPVIIYNYILKKFCTLLDSNELMALKVVLNKLLYFRITNLKDKKSIKKYYGNSNPELAEYNLNLGIPQGLPQSYYFGNICMVLVAKEFDNIFPGQSFFYVDDSVIYTNSDNAAPKNFQQSLLKLNKRIKESLNTYAKFEGESNCELLSVSSPDYVVQVHKEDKSLTFDIKNTPQMNTLHLMPIALVASRIAFELHNTLSSTEDDILDEKVNAILKAIEQEIKNVQIYLEQISPEDIKANIFQSYLKSLKRYMKFFTYRKNLLEFRSEKDIKELKEAFEETYFVKNSSMSDEKRAEIFKNFEEDVFLAEAQLIYSNLVDDKAKKIFKTNMLIFESALVADVDRKNLYFHENLKNIDTISNNIYTSLKETMQKKLPNFSNSKTEIQVNRLKDIINQKMTEQPFYGYGENGNYDSIIYNISNEYQRKLLNAYISKVLHVDLSDDVRVQKKDNRCVNYYELRILCYIRNRNCKIPDFLKFLQEINVSEWESRKSDPNIYDVLHYFIKYVKDPDKVDDLILVHKYVSGIWKNGSQFLYFYTLHNQEHSIELIKSTVNLCKTIDYLQIKKSDYYILFLSCYLHDISMVLQPSFDRFANENYETDKIYSDFCLEKEKTIQSFDDKENVKRLMQFAFEQLATYFEKITRDSHAYESAAFIRNSGDLDFLGNTIRHFVASVSEAHGYNVKDVYDLKSKAKTENVSEKYMMILLRLADLLDVSKDRVSLNILKQNIKNMPEISQFHWVTHAITDELKIFSSYHFEPSQQEKGKFVTSLNRKNLSEKIIVEINLNASNLTKVESLKCKNTKASLQKKEDKIIVQLGEGKQCREGNCTFLCKWIFSKNNYLLKELNSLQTYLNRTTNNIFETKIEIILNYKNAMPMPNEYFDIAAKQIT